MKTQLNVTQPTPQPLSRQGNLSPASCQSFAVLPQSPKLLRKGLEGQRNKKQRPQTSHFKRVPNAGCVTTPHRNSQNYILHRKTQLLSMKNFVECETQGSTQQQSVKRFQSPEMQRKSSEMLVQEKYSLEKIEPRSLRQAMKDRIKSPKSVNRSQNNFYRFERSHRSLNKHWDELHSPTATKPSTQKTAVQRSQTARRLQLVQQKFEDGSDHSDQKSQSNALQQVHCELEEVFDSQNNAMAVFEQELQDAETRIKQKFANLQTGVRQIQHMYNRVLVIKKEHMAFGSDGSSATVQVGAMDTATGVLATDDAKGALIIQISNVEGSFSLQIGHMEQGPPTWVLNDVTSDRRCVLKPREAHSERYKIEKEKQHTYDQAVWALPLLFFHFSSTPGTKLKFVCEFFSEQQRRRRMEAKLQKAAKCDPVQLIRNDVNAQVNKIVKNYNFGEELDNVLKQQKHKQRMLLLQHAMGNTGKDFVHTNRVLADRWSTHNHVHKLHRSATKQIHSEQVAERKIDLDHQSLKNKLFQAIRWRVIKDRKKEFETAVEQRKQLRKALAFPLRLILTRIILNTVLQKVAMAKGIRQIKIRLIEAQIVIASRYVRYFNRKRKGVQKRNQQQLKFSLNALKGFMEDKSEQAAKSKLYGFLQWQASRQLIIDGTQNYYKQLEYVQTTFKGLYKDMQHRRSLLQFAFDKQFEILLIQYTTLARKNSKFKKAQKILAEGVDEAFRDFLIEEYFSGVCRKYVRYLQMVQHELNLILQEQLSSENSENGSTLLATNRNFAKLYPIKFGVRSTAIIRNEQRRLRHHIQNVFDKTQVEETKQTLGKHNLLDKIQKACLYGLPTDDGKPFTVREPMELPVFRCIPDPETMKRIVQKYILLKKTGKNKDGLIPAFPKFVPDPGLD